MRLEKIEFKNIGGYGNKIHEIDYGSDGKLILLSGRSGAGKSILLNIPCLLFYGKVDKLSNSSVANRVNKNGWIRGTVSSGSGKYVIERTFSPNSIKVFKDGNDIQAIGVKDSQSYINDNIIKIPYQIFTNIICLTMKDNRFKSFLNMTASDRREIIDRIFGLEIINDVSVLIKKDMRDTGNAINSENTRQFTLTGIINKANQELTEISEKNDSEDNGRIQTNNDKIQKETDNITNLTNKINILDAGYRQLYAKYTEENTKLQNLNNSANELIRKINLFQHEQCPTCGTSLKSAGFQELKQKTEMQYKEIIPAIQRQKENMKASYDRLMKIANGKSILTHSVNNSNSNISSLRAENGILQKRLSDDKQYTSIERIITENTLQKKESEKKLSDLQKAISELNTLSMLYSIDGVKKEILKNYIPHLNEEIRKSLGSLDFPYQLTFNDNFDAILTSMSEEIGADTLSNGEHKRVDLAVLCSIFKLLKRKYPAINIFTLDEVLSSLDPDTTADMLKFLKDFTSEMKLNTFVVSHVEMPAELFDVHIKVEKEMGFSDFEIIS